jgi:hypothetical protein
MAEPFGRNQALAPNNTNNRVKVGYKIDHGFEPNTTKSRVKVAYKSEVTAGCLQTRCE